MNDTPEFEYDCEIKVKFKTDRLLTKKERERIALEIATLDYRFIPPYIKDMDSFFNRAEVTRTR